MQGRLRGHMPIESSVKNWSYSYTVNSTFYDIDTANGNQVGYGTSSTKTASVSGTNTRSRTTQDNPRWRDLIASHGNATTPFSASEDVTEVPTGSASSTTNNLNAGILRTTTTLLNGPFPILGFSVSSSSTVLNSAFADAKAKIYAKLAALQTPVQGGVIIGELRETLHMIKHPAEGLSNLILGEQFLSTKAKLRRASLRKRRPLKGNHLRRSLSKAVADSWLENAFGWQPLMSDINSAMSAYNDLLNKVEYHPLRATGKAEETVGAPLVNDWALEGFIAYRTFDYRSQNAKVYVYGEARTQPSGLRARLGLTWGQFVPTVWELLPFSFLADYFINIGQVLANCYVDIGAVQRLSSTYVNVGLVETVLTDFRYSGTQSATSYGHASGSSPRYKRKIRQISRSDTFDISTAPSLQFHFPFSARKWLNMGALIASNWKRGISSAY